jgi:hypothetical protein
VWQTLEIMKRSFLVHSLNHTALLVDISEIGLPTEVYPPKGKSQPVPSIRFQSWRDAEDYLRGLGADQGLLETTAKSLSKAGVAVLTIS